MRSFRLDALTDRKNNITEDLKQIGLQLSRDPLDRSDIPIDCRFSPVLVPGCHVLPALYRPTKKWRLAEHADPLDYLEGDRDGNAAWRNDYSTIKEPADKMIEVLDDQARRCQILNMSEQEARSRFPRLAKASLGANRKDKRNGTITGGTRGIFVNRRTRLRDQKRAPLAAVMRFCLSSCSVLSAAFHFHGNKTAGGDTAVKVGFKLLYRIYPASRRDARTGSSVRRQKWQM